jgi:twinkle protein
MSKHRSDFVGHEACPRCGSSDNLARYSDGHAVCFSTNCDYFEAAPGGKEGKTTEKKKKSFKFFEGEFKPLGKRKITESTCSKWGYQVGRHGDKTIHIANYYRAGQVVFQKIRYPNKDFIAVGDIEQAGFYGQHMWNFGKMLVITEGEIDALSVSQLQNHKWPVVSIPNGTKGAAKVFRREIEWLEGFETVVIMFDMDEPGQTAAKECAALLSAGKVKIAHLPLKDPNEMLVADKGHEVIAAIWNATPFRPDGIIEGKATWEQFRSKRDVPSVPYPWESMNIKTHGARKGEIVTFTAGTGIGKSTVCREIAHYLIKKGERVGYIALEESVGKTTESLMSIECDTPLHLNPDKFNEEELHKIWMNVFDNDRVYLYDHWGSLDLDNLMARLNYFAKGCQCDWIFLDHISIVISGLDDGDERKLIDVLMTRLRAFVESTKVGMFIVSHLKRPEGRTHEEGGKVSLGHLRGSGSIAQLSDMAIALERDQQGEDNNESTIRILKNRFSGETGQSGILRYVPETGRLIDAGNPFDFPAEAKGEL